MKRNQKNLTATGESISWNAQNQPISMNGVSATYDALGRMVETGSGGSYKQFVFTPDGNPYAIYNAGTSTLIKGTVPLPAGDTAIYNQSGLSYLRHTDWLGSSRLATTWVHAVYSKTAYAPFGETYNEAGTADRSFTGQDQDVVSGSGGTGAYDFLFRKQDPSAGRWLSPDPAGWGAVDQTNPQTLNRYAYAGNSPTNNTDSAGLYQDQIGNCYYTVYTYTQYVITGTGTSSEGGYTFHVDANQAFFTVWDGCSSPDVQTNSYELTNMIQDAGTSISVNPSVEAFGPKSTESSCLRTTVLPTGSSCNFICEGKTSDGEPTLSHLTKNGSEISKVCGSSSFCPSSMTVQNTFFFIGPIGFSMGTKILACRP